jgi:beta-glucuronidase
MKHLLICFWLLAGFASAESPVADLIADVPGRTTIGLDGTWNTIVDPYETGVGSRFYQNVKPKDKTQLVEYDFDASEKLQVPGDWNTQREGLLFYEVYFGAANYQARVWLNGKKLGEHAGGFTAFNFEVSEETAEGSNSIVVEVSNTRSKDGVPALNTDWWNYGGYHPQC